MEDLTKGVMSALLAELMLMTAINAMGVRQLEILHDTR